MCKITAVIPARFGSKRVRNKNFRPFWGKSLVDWTIETAVQANIFDQIILSSDFIGAEKNAKRYGIQFELRCPELSNDQSASIDVIDSLASQRKLSSRFAALLQPTSPLRTATQVREAYEQFTSIDSPTKSLVSVFDTSDQYRKSLIKIGDFVTCASGLGLAHGEYSQAQKIFAQNGAIYIVEVEEAIRQRSFIYANCLPFQMDAISSIDIDNWDDFKLAEILMKERVSQSSGAEDLNI
tara:strand:- start:3627 stop:4343 length:717 start_codon:yes stop_codon:yes gene_type:complete